MPFKRSDPSLTLIVPDLVFTEASCAGSPSILARLAGRGAVSAIDVGDQSARAFALWELAVLRCCGLRPEADSLASAPLNHLGRTGTFDSHPWAHLEAVHLAAGLNDVAAMQLSDASSVTQEEHVQLTATLNEHLTGESYELRSNEHTGWLLRSTRALKAVTTAPEHAFRGPLQQSLPAGEHGAELRRLMTELQMLLHEHPINHARTSRSLPAVNAVWLWGLGTIASRAAPEPSLPRAYGHRNFLKGLYLLHGQSIRAETFTLSSLLDDTKADALAIVEVREPDALDSQWLEPLMREMRGGALRRLNVCVNRWRITVSRGELLRFWRKPRTHAQWSA